MFLRLEPPIRHMFLGNALLIGCAFFYLLWWILCFKPTGAIRGMRSGWLLIPAVILGLSALFFLIRGTIRADMPRQMISPIWILAGGVVVYFVLLAATWFLLHRQVTTELFLIVIWTVLAFLEVNALYGFGHIERGGVIALFIVAVATAILSMVCYILYYGLGPVSGYIDGMIPLIFVVLYMGAMMIVIARTADG